MFQYYVNVFRAQVETIEKAVVLKWALYLIEIIFSGKVFGKLYDKIKFRIGNTTHCFAYGTITKCNFGIYMNFICLYSAMYALCLSFFSLYKDLPEIMQFDELDLCSFRLGIWCILSKSLSKWVSNKYRKKYFMKKSNTTDMQVKLKRTGLFLAEDLRSIQNNSNCAMFFLVVIIVLILVEKK